MANHCYERQLYNGDAELGAYYHNIVGNQVEKLEYLLTVIWHNGEGGYQNNQMT
jgi:hypothetical protein